jgi:CheY-like chemotaxis protein
VLLIDDDGDTREIYAQALRPEGLLVAEARDGHEGLQKALESRPDLIITDIAMPIMDGWQLVRGLRGDERTRHIPIIVCSGNDRPRVQLDVEPDAYLGKPCDPAGLRREVRRLLRVHGSR